MNYCYAESTLKPLSVEETKSTVFLRKDIAEEQREFDGETVIFWIYQEAKLTPEEYAAHLAEQKQSAKDAEITALQLAVVGLYEQIVGGM
jgi:hypothetical protein